jgi:hypothetical protein
MRSVQGEEEKEENKALGSRSTMMMTMVMRGLESITEVQCARMALIYWG